MMQSTGLGRCESCGVPGAFFYAAVVEGLRGIWMCDSCVHPDVVRARFVRERGLR